MPTRSGLAGNGIIALADAYEPFVDSTAVPEPGQVAASLLLPGGIGGYVFLKRRKAAQPAAPAAA